MQESQFEIHAYTDALLLFCALRNCLIVDGSVVVSTAESASFLHWEIGSLFHVNLQPTHVASLVHDCCKGREEAFVACRLLQVRGSDHMGTRDKPQGNSLPCIASFCQLLLGVLVS